MAINKSSPWNDLQEKKNPTQTVRNSPWNNAVQTGNQEVTVQKRKLPEAPVKQGVDLTSLPGAAIGTGIAQTLSGASNLVKSVPVVAETGARAISNLAKAPVSPMTSKLNAKEVEPNDDNVVQKLANALFKQEQEKTTVELPQTEQEITKNQFQNIANKEMIAQGQTPVKQITDWTNPWDKALAQNVENVQNAGQTYSRVVTPATDWLDNASQKVTDYTEREFMANLNPTEQFVAQAAGNAIPNFARNALLATVSGGSSAVLGLLSDAFMFAPSFYQGYEEGLAKGLSEEEAMLNATLRGATEAGTEHLSDVWKVNGGQSKMDEWMLEKIAKSNLNPWAKFMGKGLASGIGESMEEVASRIGNTFADRAFYGNKIDAGQLALGSLEDAGASFISTMVMGLLGGEFSGTSRRQWNAYVDQMQNESAADVLNEAKDHKVELALTYASMSPNEAYDFVSKAQDIIRQKYGNDNEIANMDTWELVGKLDQEAVQIYDNLDDQLRQKYIDRMTNKELPLTQTTLPDGSTYNVYEYLGTRTTDQERALDMARRMGKDILFADELPMGQNALTLGDGTIIISSKAKRPATALAFHEIFHALKSDGQWNDLMDLAYNYMANEKGFSNFVEDLVSRYVSYYGNLDNNYLNSITASKELTDEQKRQEVKDYLREQGVNQYYTDPNFHNMIDEEIAAEFLERFNNEDTIKAMYNRSGDLFDRTWQNLKDAVQNFTGVLTKDEQELKNAERLFAKVANQAKEEQQRAEDKLLRNGYNFHQGDGTLYSVGYSTAAENLANVDRAQLIKDIVTASNGAITEERADEFVRNEEVMAMSIKDTALDFEAEPGETAIKSNTDYPQGTIDLTNNCTKRRPITFMTNRLQEALPDDLFTADDYADIRLIMMDDGRVVACGLCFVEDRRKQLGEIAQNFRDEWANSEDGYLWRSNSSGKRIKVSIGEDLAKRYGVNPGDVTVNDLNMRQVDFGSSDSWHKFQKEHPYEAAAFEAFNNARGQNAGRLLVPRAEYKREILYWSPEKVKAVNDLGGLRIFSFSDFESIHMLDIIQIIEDCAARGVMIQGYTKQPNFAKLVRNTGIKLNRSLIPYGATGLKMANGKWVLAMNTSEGMDIQSKDFLDETDNPNVGNNITGINDRQIHVAMTDDFIHYIIPFHTGKSNKANLRLGVGKWDNYKDYQTDKSLSPEDTRRLALRTSELKAQGVADTEAYKKAMKELEIKPTKGKMINIYTEVLSDPSVTDVVSFQNKFFDVCYEKGIIPRFSQFLDTDQYGNYVYTPGYEKMLVDFKLFDRDGNVLKQEIVRPDFDKGFMQQVIDEDLKKTEEERQGADYPQELYDKVLNYIRVKHGYEGDYQAYEELKNKIDKNVTQLNSDDESVQGYALSPSVTNSLMELNVQRPTINDKYSQFASPAAAYSLSDGQEEYFLNSQARDENGNLIEMYHGSPNKGITEFDPSRAGEHTGAYGDRATWFTPNRDFAEEFAYQFLPGSSNLTYTRGEPGEVYPAYLNITNPLDFNNLTDEQRDLFRDELARYGTTDKEAQDEFIDALLGYGNHQYLKMFLDYDRARNEGYDGIIDRLYAIGQNRGDDLEYGIFNANQAKSPDNLNPSESNDIRYSLDEEQTLERKPYQTNGVTGEDLRPYIKGLLNEDGQVALTAENHDSFEKSIKRQIRKLVDNAVWNIEDTNNAKLTINKSKTVNALYEALIGKRCDIHDIENSFARNNINIYGEREINGVNRRSSVNNTFIEALLGYMGFDGIQNPESGKTLSRDENGQRQIIEDSMNLNAETPQQRDETVNALAEAMQNEYIPESIDQANKYPDRRYQQTKGDMKVLGDIDRENNNTEDPERTQDVRPETFIPPFEPSDIKSYNELFEDGHEERNPNKEELEFYQSLNEKMEKGKGGNSAGGAIGFLTPDQFFDHVAGRNTAQRKILDEKFGRPMFDAKKGYTQNIREKNDGLKQIVEETGIYGGTEESAAVQWYGEGQKPIGDNKVEPYTLDDLKRDFPEKWEDIVKMEQYMRKQYDEYVDRWNAMLTQIYPHPERMLLRNLNSWRIKLNDLRSELELTDPNDVALVEDYRTEIAKLEQKIAEGQEAYDSGDYLRNKRLQPRKDYFHHIREVEQNGFGNVKNILQAITQATGKGNIDPDLVDVSQYTQPRTKWSGILQRRNSNDYTADAVTSFARYVNEAEYAIAMNPVISQYRDEISKIRKATKQTKNANTMIDYLAKYTNDLAGKTNYLDTAMREFLGGEGNRNALLTAVEAINRRGKANAVVGNLRSAIAQFYNIPNALSVIKSLPAWRKGFNDYMSAKAGNRELLDQSPFLAERYGGLNEKDFRARDTVWKQIEGKLSDFSNKMMEFGDREATELIWLSAYNEGLEKGVDDPVYYADSMARRAVGGRGIGEVPFGMNSKLVGLFAPFQVEANNQWQNLKGMIEDKDAEGIFRLMLGSYLMNILARAIFNDGVLPDPLEALEEGIRRLFAKDREDSVGQIMGDTAKRVAGETVSMIPGTSLWLPLVMGDNAETFFGDSDPTRYGTGTVGVKNLFDVAADAINGDGFDAVTPLLNLGLPYGGKQVSRMYNTLQDLNVLPSNGFMNTPIGGEKNPTAGSYSNAGALRYQLPNEVDSAQDIVEIARALAFGSNSTDAAQEYFNNGNKPVLSKERVAKLREHPEVSAENYITYLKEASTDDKQGISQQEAYDWLSSHNLSDEERNALWEMTSNSWQKSYDEYVPKEETPKEEKTENKTEKKSGKPTTKKEFTDAADANNSGRLSQAEAYDWLNSQRLSDAEKEALWNLMGWKTDYETYASKH